MAVNTPGLYDTSSPALNASLRAAEGILSAGPVITQAVAAETLATEVPSYATAASGLRSIPQRFLEIVPAALSLLVISFLIWGPFVTPIGLATFVLFCQGYWLWRSHMVGIHAVRGFILMKRHAKIDWRQLYKQEIAAGRPGLEWDRIWHVVVIPNYTESVAKLSVSLDSLAESEMANHIIAVLAMEEREGPEAERKATHLMKKYAGRLGRIIATFHPGNIPGEVAGKSSNEAWAAREAKRRLVDTGEFDLDYLTITSCDADTCFHSKYFSCLTYHFALNSKRYRRFWQSPIFYYNNIWDIPAPMRLPHALGGLSDLARVSRKWFRMVFPQSSYSLSFKMADEVGYWDTDVIPEDWHMFLKTFYELRGEVDVETIFLPMHMDGMRSKSYWGSFIGYYRQVRRWAWGCCDFPYAINQAARHPEVPTPLRLRRLWSLLDSHVQRTTSWFLITVGRDLPLFMITFTGFGTLPDWFPTASRWILTPCLASLIIVSALDFFLRPQRPPTFRWRHFIVQYAQWFLMPFISFLFTVLPALDAQIRLALGKRLEYKVTEKA